jgi:hypothetical protein
MKISLVGALACLAATFLCGCYSHKPSGPVYHPGDEKPPDFLGGPITTVLTNRGGFSAHVVITVASPQSVGETNVGELLQRDGRLIFEPEVESKKKHALAASGLLFIWDETKHTGYIVSEELQGYAPVKPALDVPALAAESTPSQGASKELNGHSCRRADVVVPLSNGLKVPLTVWKADDANEFPVRIECSNGSDVMTLNFSEIRFETPPEDLFEPPDGFTAYASSTSLMNELIMRGAENSAPGKPEPHPSNWHPMPNYH